MPTFARFALAAGFDVHFQAVDLDELTVRVGQFLDGPGIFQGRNRDEKGHDQSQQQQHPQENQNPDGSFDSQHGKVYATSMACLALALNYRFLPIYER